MLRSRCPKRFSGYINYSKTTPKSLTTFRSSLRNEGTPNQKSLWSKTKGANELLVQPEIEAIALELCAFLRSQLFLCITPLRAALSSAPVYSLYREAAFSAFFAATASLNFFAIVLSSDLASLLRALALASVRMRLSADFIFGKCLTSKRNTRLNNESYFNICVRDLQEIINKKEKLKWQKVSIHIVTVMIK